MRHTPLPPWLALPLLALPLLAAAQPVEIYGRMNASVDFLDTDGNGESLNLSSNSSRIGFRGNHYFETHELTVLWQAETTLRIDNQGNDWIDRDTFVGARGDWGLLRFGKFNTPLKRLRSQVDFFSDQVGDARNILRNRIAGPGGQGPIGWDERFRNGIAYRTPAWRGMTGEGHYATRLDGDGTSTSDTHAWSASLTWQGEHTLLALAHEQQQYVDTDGDGLLTGDLYRRKATRVAGWQDIGSLRLAALYQHADNPDDKAYGGGARYALDERWALKMQFYRLDADDEDLRADLYAAGVDYTLARNMLFYVSYAWMDNGDAATLRPYAQGRTTGGGSELATVPGGSPSGLSLGGSYRF
ncbi:porin [Alcanivorax sp. JB21]|uniref:porin n=1 Tax=Alcanivorax limicola TaxID=2874102 RepID=UPI001CBE4D0D|nr:porin [Alcanivorax limicola]MBZ2190020.1 porin [Alcanivorax limicola]